ncbi:MAG: methyltransferase [Clostridia bacterium]
MDNERIDKLGILDLKIIQNKEYFCFGIDSVLLANFVNSNSSKNVILDLCSGSGVIPIIISAKKKYSKIFAVELQEKMYELLDRNIKLNNLEESIIGINEDIKKIDKIKKIIIRETSNGTVDTIVVNPPYKKKGTGIYNPTDIKYIARHEEMCTLEDVFKTSCVLLNTKGKLYIVHKPERLADLICIARGYRLEAKKIRLVYPTKSSKPSIVLVEYVKDGGNEVNILEPLIEFKDDGTYSDEIRNIYDIKKENN